MEQKLRLEPGSLKSHPERAVIAEVLDAYQASLDQVRPNAMTLVGRLHVCQVLYQACCDHLGLFDVNAFCFFPRGWTRDNLAHMTLLVTRHAVVVPCV